MLVDPPVGIDGPPPLGWLERDPSRDELAPPVVAMDPDVPSKDEVLPAREVSSEPVVPPVSIKLEL